MAIKYVGAKRLQGLKSDRVSDSLGSSADGVNTNVTLDTTNEKIGTGCYNFDGSGDKTAIGTSTTLSFLTDGSTDWTIAFWMKLNATEPNGNNAIFCQGQGNEQGLDILFDDRSGESRDHVLGVRMEGVGGHTPLKLYTGAQFISKDTNWHHYVITADISTRTITAYRDNANAVSDSTGSGAFPSASDLDAPMTFGYHPSTGFGDLNAKLDDCGIWNRILTSDERTSLWNSGNGTLANTISGGLKAYYSFDKLYDEAYKSTYGQSTEEFIMTNSITNSSKACGVKIINTSHNGKKIINGKWKLRRAGTLSGNCYMRVWNSTASADVDTNVEATSQAVDMSTISTNYDYVTFNFDSEVTLSNGYVIGIFTKDISDGSSSKCIKFGEFHNGSSTIPSGYNLQCLDKDTSGWTDTGYPTLITPDAVFTSKGCVNENSTTSSLDALTGVRTNTIFEQTDGVPSYYWYQTLDSTAGWFPTFQDSMTDSSVWTTVGSNITITDGAIQASSMVTQDDGGRIYCDIGKALSTKFVVDFDHYADTASSGGYWQMFALTDTTAIPRTDTNILALIDMGSWRPYLRYSVDGTETNIDHLGGDLTTGKWQYIRFVRDGTTGTLYLYNDSARTDEALSVSGTIPATVTGLRYFQTGAIYDGNDGTTTYKIKSLKIYDGVTSV